MPVIPGIYHIQFGLEFSAEANLPPPKPLYLTSNGEGKQLTVEHPLATGENLKKQEWSIQLPLEDENFKLNLADRIIIPARSILVIPVSQDALAVSQDVVKSPDDVYLIKNLQVWTFEPVRQSDNLYEIRSNLYRDFVGSDPLLGVDKEFKKAIIQFIPVIEHPPPKPVWKLIPVGPLSKE